MPIYVAGILGGVAALVCTILVFIMILPDKKRSKLNAFFKYIHDLFNFKSLWLEKILKFFYVLNTLFCVFGGFFMLFCFTSYSFYGYSRTEYFGYYGLILIVAGPIVVRIVYEFAMMMILAVKNLIDINNKLNPQEGSVADKIAKDREAAAAQRAAQKQQAYAQQQQAYAQQQNYAQQNYNQGYAQNDYAQQNYAQQNYAQGYAQQDPYTGQYGQDNQNPYV